jgi:hypothetical protein
LLNLVLVSEGVSSQQTTKNWLLPLEAYTTLRWVTKRPARANPQKLKFSKQLASKHAPTIAKHVNEEHIHQPFFASQAS